MGAMHALKSGIAATNANKRLLALLLIINLLFGLLMTTPVYRLIQDSVGESLMGDRLAQGFDYQWYFEFQREYAHAIPPIGSTIQTATVIYLLLSIVLMGGILATLVPTDNGFSLRRFFEGCSRYCLRFFGVAIIGLILYWLVLVWLNRGLSSLLGRMTTDPTAERWAFAVNWLRYAILFVIACFINLILDYTKIRIVIDEPKSLFAGLTGAIRLVFGHLKTTIGLYAMVGLMGLLFLVIYYYAEQGMSGSTRAAIIAVFVLQQLSILARLWIRVTFYSSQMRLYTGLRPAPTVTTAAPVPEHEASPSGLTA